jgi:hypothetical protein
VKWFCCSVVLHLEEKSSKICEIVYCECDLRWIYKTQIIFSLNKAMIRTVCIFLTGIWSTDLLSQLQMFNKITQTNYIYYNNFASSNLYKLDIFRGPHKALLIIFQLPFLLSGQYRPTRFIANYYHISELVPVCVSKVLVLVILSGTGGVGAIASRGRGELERVWVEDWVTTDCELLEGLERSVNCRWATLLSWELTGIA